jgi:hypothetical protein
VIFFVFSRLLAVDCIMPRSKLNRKTSGTDKPLLQMATLVYVHLMDNSKKQRLAFQPTYTRRMQSF